MSEKGKLVEKARKLGREYLDKYKECGPTTLLAVADTLNMRACDDLFKVMIGQSGQSGGCGGICGATAVIGLKFIERVPYNRIQVNLLVLYSGTVLDKNQGEYDTEFLIDRLGHSPVLLNEQLSTKQIVKNLFKSYGICYKIWKQILPPKIEII